MKLRIEINDEYSEEEIIIKCGGINETVQQIQLYIQNLVTPKLIFYKGEQEFYLGLEEILFFETSSEQVYAHTRNDAFRVRYRLYELEDILTRSFVRVSKGTIVNISHIYAISRDLTTGGQIQFNTTHKRVHVSRHYYKVLKGRMSERGVQK